MNNNQYIKKIAEQMEELGVKSSGVLLVHTSLKAMGDVVGGADSVVKGIQFALGDKGTLLMPTLTYSAVDGIVNDTFSAKDTVSEVGALTEYFRTMEGVIRSIHPTHSVCGIGNYAKEMLGTHQLDQTPCGPHSPYKLLSEIGGQILLIGCGLEANTSMHGVEELIEPEYLFEDTHKYRVYNEKREKNYVDCKRHGFKNVKQCYGRLADLLEEGKTIKKGKILNADCYLIDAKAMWKVAYDKMQENPLYFVEVL